MSLAARPTRLPVRQLVAPCHQVQAQRGYCSLEDASEDWAIEQVEGDQYFVINLLDYGATDVEILGPDVTGTRCGLGFLLRGYVGAALVVSFSRAGSCHRDVKDA